VVEWYTFLRHSVYYIFIVIILSRGLTVLTVCSIDHKTACDFYLIKPAVHVLPEVQRSRSHSYEVGMPVDMTA